MEKEIVLRALVAQEVKSLVFAPDRWVTKGPWKGAKVQIKDFYTNSHLVDCILVVEFNDHPKGFEFNVHRTHLSMLKPRC